MAKRKEITIRSSAAEYLTFISAVGDQPESVELRYQDENIWLTQRLMAELYGVDVPTINYHIQQIYKDNELTEGATIRNFRIVQKEGVGQKWPIRTKKSSDYIEKIANVTKNA